jgi:hypothetical protein
MYRYCSNASLMLNPEKKDMGVPKLQSSKVVGKQPMPYGKSKVSRYLTPQSLACTTPRPPD